MTAHALLERHVRDRPDAVAVSDGSATLTYAELHARASVLAAELAGADVRSGDAVGLLAHRGIEAVVATVAISLAGAVCVPLDPAYPEPRLRLMLAHPRLRGVLTGDDLADRVPAGIPVLAPGGPRKTVAAQAGPIATVMYTSGSTGTPKGVEITHRGIVRLVTDRDALGFTQDDVVLNIAPATFDASLFELWGALASGARLEIAPPGQLTLSELAELIGERGITVLWLTAGLFHQVAEYEPDCFAGVRRLFTGGDVVSPAHVRALFDRHPALEIVNGYGPTENTTFTCCHVMRSAADLTGTTVPIGRPIAATTVVLVDQDGRPVPPGEPGELWTGGDGLAAGYLGRPDLTAERFVTPADGPVRGQRLYRTGDLARCTEDGVLEFLGRGDAQVKVNGHRIEPAEVEAAIADLPDVRQVCVLVEQDPMGGKRLVAHLVGAQPDRTLAKRVRAALLDRLPPFMIPARYAVVDELPLTHNGKIDRALLLGVRSDR